jgi:hypothetical protein
MPSSRRHRLIALAATAFVMAGLPAVALAAKIKDGYYIDPKLQVYVIAGGGGTIIKSVQGPCMITPEGGGDAGQQGGYVIKKHLKVSGSGKFAYDGKTTLQSGSKSVIKIKVAGQFKSGKAKGTITFDGETSLCNTISFSGKYYGKHPEG